MTMTLKAGVMGWPISHSRSPRLHGHWLARYNIDGTYEAMAVAPKDLGTALGALSETGFRGVNLTVPHKQAALPLVDELDYAARLIGAVNTIVVGDGGVLQGSNTDAYGFVENIRDVAPNALETNWKGRPAVVLGAGGAARAVCAALMTSGTSAIRLVNRTRARADELIADVQGLADIATSVDWDERALALAGAGLLVNTTVLGMAGQEPLDLDLAALPVDALVNDIVYAPLETNLLRRAKMRGNIIVDGLGMLLHQARPGFHAWFGIDPVVDDALRVAVLSDD